MPLNPLPVPSSDRAFARVVGSVAARAHSARELVEQLRPMYPDVSASERTLSEEPKAVYVYRDGYLQAESAERWWEDRNVAQVRLDPRTGAIVDGNDSLAHQLGSPGVQLAGRSFVEFMAPDAMPAAAAMIETIMETGAAHSSIVLRRTNGELVGFEFHAVRDGQDIVAWYRKRQGPG